MPCSSTGRRSTCSGSTPASADQAAVFKKGHAQVRCSSIRSAHRDCSMPSLRRPDTGRRIGGGARRRDGRVAAGDGRRRCRRRRTARPKSDGARRSARRQLLALAATLLDLSIGTRPPTTSWSRPTSCRRPQTTRRRRERPRFRTRMRVATEVPLETMRACARGRRAWHAPSPNTATRRRQATPWSRSGAHDGDAGRDVNVDQRRRSTSDVEHRRRRTERRCSASADVGVMSSCIGWRMRADARTLRPHVARGHDVAGARRWHRLARSPAGRSNARAKRRASDGRPRGLADAAYRTRSAAGSTGCRRAELAVLRPRNR